MGGFKLNITDPSLLDDLLHPHVQSLMQPKFGAPSPNQPTTQVPMRPSGPELEAPPNVPQTPQGAMPASGSPSSIPKPTRQESNAAGKAEFKAGMPTLTEEPGTSGYFQKQLEQQDYKKEHPWGSPISEQPGFLGKLGHIAGRIGNIAGDVLAPGVTSLIPGSDLNNAMQRRSEIGNFDRAKQQEIQQEAVEQKPEIAEATGELKGRLESQKEQAAADRQQTSLDSQESRADQREKAAEQARGEQNAQADKRQQASFGEQEKLADKRESGQERRLQETLAQRENAAGRKDVVTHDKEYVKPAEDVERSYQLYREAQDAFNRGDAKTGAASMLALSQHLATTFGQVKGSRMNKDLIQEHKDAIGVEDKIDRFVENLKTGQQLAPDQIKEFGDLIGNMRRLTWQIAAKEADRKKIPVDFLPQDLSGTSHIPGQTSPATEVNGLQIIRDANGRITGVK